MATYITFVLDETGSMSSIKEETIAGFNSYVKELRKELDDVRFSFMKFDSEEMNWVYRDVDLLFVKKLSDKNYKPRAMTPLWDAFGLAIKDMEKKKVKKDDKVIISVLTDGHENDSKEFTAKEVAKMVKEHKDWAINFLGADMDAWGDVGRGLGMAKGSTFTFSGSDIEGTLGVAASASVSYARGETTVDTFYTDNSGTAKLENFDSEPE